MSKSSNKLDFESFVTGLILAGYISPKNIQEIEEREKLNRHDKFGGEQ